MSSTGGIRMNGSLPAIRRPSLTSSAVASATMGSSTSPKPYTTRVWTWSHYSLTHIRMPVTLGSPRNNLFSCRFEKLFGGKFLGEITRRVLVDLAENNLLFDGKTSDQLRQFEIFTSKDLSTVER